MKSGTKRDPIIGKKVVVTSGYFSGAKGTAETVNGKYVGILRTDGGRPLIVSLDSVSIDE